MIRMDSPTGRNTDAHSVTLAGVTLYFSYNTLIAVDGPRGKLRRENEWGSTTGRHINEMGLRDFDVTGPCELERFAFLSIATDGSAVRARWNV